MITRNSLNTKKMKNKQLGWKLWGTIRAKIRQKSEKKEQNKRHPVIMESIILLWIKFFWEKQSWFEMMCGHASLSKKRNKSNYPLLPNLSLPKNFFQITLNKGHPHAKGWNNVCICFIWMVVHQYKNIKRKKKKEMVISRKEKKKRSKRWTRRSQRISEWNIIQRSLFETTLTSLVWAFTIIYFHTPSLGHNISLIKSTQIKDWLLSFEGFNLEENFDFLTSLF